MNTTLLIRARKHFATDYVSHNTNRRYMRQWIRSVRLLGDKWLLLAQVPRVEKARHE